MATCRYCNARMDWGQNDEGKWVKLVPIGEDVGMDRTHQDENAVLRAQHVCSGWTPAVRVVKLATPISSGDIIGQASVELSTDNLSTFVERRPKRQNRKATIGPMTVPLKHMKGRKSE